MKYIKPILILLLAFLLQGCVFVNPKYINITKKPSANYYTDLLYKKIHNKEPFKLKVFNRNLYKYYSVDAKDNNIIQDFIESLNKASFTSDFPYTDKSKYQLIIEFEDIKFIFNAYDKQYVSLYPWDGSYTEDTIDMKEVSNYNNIYDFCQYIINKHNN